MAAQSPLGVFVSRVRGRVERVPWDLVAASAVAAGVAAAPRVPQIGEAPLRPLVGLALLFFLPGYAVVAILFPHRDAVAVPDRVATVGAARRVALSFAASLAALPPLALVWWTVDGRVELIPAALAGFVCLASLVAWARRAALPPAQRFSPSVTPWVRAGYRSLSAGPRADRALNTVVLLSVLFATIAVGYAVAVPTDGESYSGLYLATEDDDRGVVAGDYPSEFARNESRELVVGVRNRERARTDYTVVVEIQQVSTDDGAASVRSERELHRFEFALGAAEDWQRVHEVTPATVGDLQRLQYYLYRGDAPADPTAASAYRTTHVWINVSAPSG